MGHQADLAWVETVPKKVELLEVVVGVMVNLVQVAAPPSVDSDRRCSF